MNFVDERYLCFWLFTVLAPERGTRFQLNSRFASSDQEHDARLRVGGFDAVGGPLWSGPGDPAMLCINSVHRSRGCGSGPPSPRQLCNRGCGLRGNNGGKLSVRTPLVGRRRAFSPRAPGLRECCGPIQRPSRASWHAGPRKRRYFCGCSYHRERSR